VASLTGHTGFVAGVWFSPQGDALASAASDGTVSVAVQLVDDRGVSLPVLGP
jgi:WD40 repeat protein